jgi:NADP-dependent aldehyde dehydrogenase
MPPGVFNMIYGGTVGAWLVQHPAIKAVGFTGSLKGGRALCDMAAARPEPIPVFAEMSSVNPVIVLPQALKTRSAAVAAELIASVVQGAGQFCTKPGMVIGIRSPEFDGFVQQLGQLVSAQPPHTLLNSGGLCNYAEGLVRLHDHPQIQHRAGRLQEGSHAHPQLFEADVELLMQQDERLQHEVFGPVVIVVAVNGPQQLEQALQGLQGQLTATLIADSTDLDAFAQLIPLLEMKAGRLLINGYPTGVEVCDAMVHGGPYPATSDARGSSVGTLAINRFLRPICFQNYPDSLLPDALKDANPLDILRLVDGTSTHQPVIR